MGARIVNDESPLPALALLFAVLSFFAIGGANAVIPEMHRQTVDIHQWMTSERFTDLYAIAQAAPGPNIIVVTLVGWQVAGLAGAFVATIAMVAPTSLLAYAVGRIWHRFRFARWRIAIQNGVAPLTVGLVAASAFVLARSVDKSLLALGVTVATAVAVTLTRVHPLVFLLAGAAIGAAGLL